TRSPTARASIHGPGSRAARIPTPPASARAPTRRTSQAGASTPIERAKPRGASSWAAPRPTPSHPSARARISSSLTVSPDTVTPPGPGGFLECGRVGDRTVGLVPTQGNGACGRRFRSPGRGAAKRTPNPGGYIDYTADRALAAVGLGRAID